MKLPIRLMWLTAVLAALALASCAEPVKIVAPALPPPLAQTPLGAVKLLEWAVTHRDIDAIRSLLTEDFTLVSAGSDSAGNPVRELLCRRADLLARLEELFFGTTTSPPALDIRLAFDRNLVAQPDPRPEYAGSDLFRTIRTSLDLLIQKVDGTRIEKTGHAVFYLARGDTVLIPRELESRGFQKDRTRWWITRWEDETVASEGILLRGK